MAKDYGTAIKPSAQADKLITDMCDHLNWSKSDVVSHCVAVAHSSVMEMPRALRPGEIN